MANGTPLLGDPSQDIDGGVGEDLLMDGRLRLLQPARGYRVAIDPLFLAASIDVAHGDTILDMGAGVGTAGLCVALRAPSCRVVGIEIQRELVRLANQNAALNHLLGRFEVIHGDLQKPPLRFAPGTFAQALANPPYFDPEEGRTSSNLIKAGSHIAQTDLKCWVDFAHIMLRPRGVLTFIYRASKIEQLLGLVKDRFGDLVIYPLWPSSGKPAKRVIVRMRKNAKGGTRFDPGLILHEDGGKFTPSSEAILRHLAPLVF